MAAYWGPSPIWAFDAAARWWRAPGEAATAPNSKPGWCNNVATAFGEPRVGWMDWVIGAAGRSVVMPCSDVVDPTADLLHFSERIVEGGTPRFFIDEEGHAAQRRALPAPAPADPGTHGHLPEPVRSALLSSQGETVPLDVVVPRRAFATDVYRAWTTALRRPRRAFAAERFGRSPPDDAANGDSTAGTTEGDFGRVRLPALDRLLRETDGQAAFA